jgi:hypothetical protein
MVSLGTPVFSASSLIFKEILDFWVAQEGGLPLFLPDERKKSQWKIEFFY